MNLSEFVELATSVWFNNQQPYYFISQKLQEYQLDKIDRFHHSRPPSRMSSSQSSQLICYRINKIEQQKTYHYMTIPKGNIIDFQLKPPVKSMFGRTLYVHR